MNNEIVKSRDLENDESTRSNLIEKYAIEPICKVNCKFCQSPSRKEAEQEYDRTKNYSAVARFLKNKDEEVSIPAIKNHIINHYHGEAQNLLIKEYAENLQEWITNFRSNEAQLTEYISGIDRQIYLLNANTNFSDLEEARKTSMVIARLTETASKIRNDIYERKKEMAPVHIVIEKLKNIVKLEITNLHSDEAKKALLGVMQKLGKELDGVPLEQ